VGGYFDMGKSALLFWFGGALDEVITPFQFFCMLQA